MVPPIIRTAGFPQYGWKVGLSGSAFPHVAQVKPAPGMRWATRRFASVLRALRGLILCPALCRDDGEITIRQPQVNTPQFRLLECR
jgi:hypothetical protein